MPRAMKKLEQSLTLIKGSFRNVLSGERFNSVSHLSGYSINSCETINIRQFDTYLDALEVLKKIIPDNVIVLGYSVYSVSEYMAETRNDEDNYDSAIVSPDLRLVLYSDKGEDYADVEETSSPEVIINNVYSNTREYRFSVVCEIKGEPFIYFFTQSDLDSDNENTDTTQTGTAKAVNTAGVVSINQENKQENKIMSKVTQLVELNKSAAINAGKIEAGNIALDQLVKLASKAVPSGIVGTMVKPYIDTPYGRVIIANVLAFAVQQYAPSNAKALLLVEATSNAALLELTQSLNLRKLIDELVDNPSIASVLDTLEKE